MWRCTMFAITTLPQTRLPEYSGRFRVYPLPVSGSRSTKGTEPGFQFSFSKAGHLSPRW